MRASGSAERPWCARPGDARNVRASGGSLRLVCVVGTLKLSSLAGVCGPVRALRLCCM